MSRQTDLEGRSRQIAKRLARAMPRWRIDLDWQTPWHLLVATILAAQNTDENVNRVTPVLFAAYPTPEALALADPGKVEDIVRSTGFFRNKTKAIQRASRALADRHGGEVPRTMEEMLELPGVARKTANVVLTGAYGIASGIVVDTHVGRLSRRLELTDDKDPVKVEKTLMALFPKKSWVDISHRLVLFGRYVCRARSPRCAECCLSELCPNAESAPRGTWARRAKGTAGELDLG